MRREYINFFMRLYGLLLPKTREIGLENVDIVFNFIFTDWYPFKSPFGRCHKTSRYIVSATLSEGQPTTWASRTVHGGWYDVRVNNPPPGLTPQLIGLQTSRNSYTRKRQRLGTWRRGRLSTATQWRDRVHIYIARGVIQCAYKKLCLKYTQLIDTRLRSRKVRNICSRSRVVSTENNNALV